MKPYNVLILILFIVPLSSMAAVLDAAPGGFTVEHQVAVPVSRAAAWEAFVEKIGSWWHSDHTVSGDAENLSINAVPLGCFCERLGDDAGLVHLQVTFANPGVMLRLSGGLGPLGLMGVAGNMTVEFEEDAAQQDHSLVTLRYAVGGYHDGGLDLLAAPVDGVLGEQITRYAAFLTAGDGSQ